MILKMLWKVNNRLVIRIELHQFKSDRWGKRSFSKTFDLPQRLFTLRSLCAVLSAPPSYWAMLRMIKSCLPHLSLHSLRRGAVTALAEAFQGNEVMLVAISLGNFSYRQAISCGVTAAACFEACCAHRSRSHIIIVSHLCVFSYLWVTSSARVAANPRTVVGAYPCWQSKRKAVAGGVWY